MEPAPTLCRGCHYDAAAVVVAAWSFTIDRGVPSLNDRKVNTGATRWDYAKQRDEWQLYFRCERLRHRITTATGRRRLIVTRLIVGRQRPYDFGNLAGGAKVIVDAMALEGLISDDSPEFLADYYHQRRSTVSGTHFELEEIR